MSLELTGEKLVFHNNAGAEKFNSDQDLIHQIGYATWSGSWSSTNYTISWDHGLNINTAGDIVVPYITITSGTDNIGSIANQFIGVRQPAQGLVPMNFDARNVDNLPTLDSAWISLYVGKDKVFLTNQSVPYNLQGGGTGLGATSQRGAVAYNAKKAPNPGIGTVYYTFEMYVYRYVTPVAYKNNSNPFIVNGGVPKNHDLINTIMGWELQHDETQGNPEQQINRVSTLATSNGLLRGYAESYRFDYLGYQSNTLPENQVDMLSNGYGKIYSNAYTAVTSPLNKSWWTFKNNQRFEYSDDFDNADSTLPSRWYVNYDFYRTSTDPQPLPDEMYFHVTNLPSDVDVYNANYATPGTDNVFRIYRVDDDGNEALIREFRDDEIIDVYIAPAGQSIKFQYECPYIENAELYNRLDVVVNAIYERDHTMWWLSFSALTNNII
jgi:hypothetical protein